MLCQIVRIMRGGEPVRMSKRAGTYVALRDLLEEVGRDAVRFTMLTRKADAQMEFDLDQAVAQTRDNPVFYVQYAHARCRSVLRGAADTFATAELTPEALARDDLGSLTDPAELGLIRRLASWPRTVEAKQRRWRASHTDQVAFFLYDSGRRLSYAMEPGQGRFLYRSASFSLAGRRTTKSWLALVAATAMVSRSGLRVMGVEPVEEMR